MKVQRKGLTLFCKSDITGQLSKLLFHCRFRNFWDIAPVERELEEQYRKSMEQERRMRRAAAQAARRRAAPHDLEVLLEGECSRYWRSDFTQLTELEQETRSKFDETLNTLEFRHVGDLVAKKQRDIVLRVYIAADELSYGILMGKRTMYLGYEFVSKLADVSTLTTTTNGTFSSHPDVGIYYKTCPGLAPAALYEKHLWGIHRFRSHKGTQPLPLDPTLLGVARAVDAAFARRAALPS
jgi:hypothetical protein